jgi:hypothetical protein
MHTTRHLLCLLATLLTPTALLAVNTNAIPVSSLPAFLNKPGNYKLTKALTQTSNSTAIVIAARDVVLDLNGFTILGSETVGDGNIGILIQGTNAVVRNGTIRKFDTAIADDGGAASGLVIEDVICVAQASNAIRLASNQNLIRRVSIRNTGQQSDTPDEILGLNLSGSAVIENCLIQAIPARTGVTPIAGMRLTAGSYVVRECDIHNVIGIGILIGPNLSTIVERARIRDCITGLSTAGIDSVVLRDSTIRNNNGSTTGGFTDGKGNVISN